MIFHIFTFLEFGRLTTVYSSQRGFGLASLRHPGRSPPEISLNGKSLLVGGVLFCFPLAHTDFVNSDTRPLGAPAYGSHSQGRIPLASPSAKIIPHISLLPLSGRWDYSSFPLKGKARPLGAPALGGVSRQVPHLGWFCPS